MRRYALKKSLCFIVLVCMLVTQLICFKPAEVKAAVNTDNVASDPYDLFSNVSGSPGYLSGYNRFRIPGIVVSQGTDTVTGAVYDVILSYAEARGGNGGDWAQSDVLVKRSVDGGQSWSAPLKIADGLSLPTSDPNQGICMNNPVMIAEKNSSVVHFFHGKAYNEVYYSRSDDAGLTWSPEVNIASVINEFRDVSKGNSPTDFFDWLVVATGPGHGIELNNGRLVVPVWLAHGTDTSPHSNSTVATIYSDDHGSTWHRGSIVIKNGDAMSNSEILSEPNESTLVQLSDGRVMINMRNNASEHRRAVSISPDGISNWSPVVLDNTLVDPLCFGSLVSYDINQILFVNNNSETSRENLTLRMSEDDGQTWAYSRLLHLGGSAYPDIAVGSDKSIYVFYERDPYKNLSIQKFGLNWLTNPPPMAQLNNITIPGADMAPRFLGENYSYDVRVAANVSSIDIIPTAYPNSTPTISINGQTATSGQAFTVPMPGEAVDIQVAVSIPNETKTYTFSVKKKQMVTNLKLENTVTNGVYDSSGYGNSNAVITGATYTDGYIGGALQFSTDNDQVDLAGINETKFGTGDFSVSTWVYADQTDSTGVLFWYGNTDSANLTEWWVRSNPGTGDYIGKGVIQFNTGCKTATAGTEINLSSSDAPIVPGKWTHIVIQRKEGIMEIYADGILKARSGSTPLNISKGPLTNLIIGKAKTGAARGWRGKMDEIRMYNYGLSTAEIQALAAQTSVDSKALYAKIAEANTLSIANYTVQSWTNLQNIISTAYMVLNSDGITQTGVDQALVDVQNAINALVPAIPVIVTANPLLGGSVTGTRGYAPGDSVTVTATANTNYQFVNWKQGENVVSINPTYTFILGTQRVDLVANFAPTATYPVTLNVNVTSGGSVTGDENYVPGSSATVTATANPGYQFINWTNGGVVVSTNSAYTFTMGSEAISLTANFRKNALVTCWKFEKAAANGLYDSSGFENTAATMNSVPYGPGYIGKALIFDGLPTATTTSNGEILNVPGINDTKFGTGDFTVTTWVYADSVSGQKIIFWYGDNNSPISQWWARTQEGTSSTNTLGKANIQFNTGNKISTNSETIVQTTNYPIVPGNWYHIAFQRAGGYMKIFLNGVEAASVTAPKYNVSEGKITNLYIGKAKPSPYRPWVGKMDEIRMYNYQLSPAEIAVLAAQAPVDSAALDAKITEARALNSSAYTAQSWTNLQIALSAADSMMDSDGLTQAGVDQAQANIQAAINSLQQRIFSLVTVTANPADWGSVTGWGTYGEGDNVTVTAAAYAGYTFTNWTKGGVVVGTNPVYTFIMGTEGVNLTANFTSIPVIVSHPVTVTASPMNGGAVTGTGIYVEGATVTVTVAAYAGYTFTNWTRGGTVVSTNPIYTFTMGYEAVNLTANFTTSGGGSTGGGDNGPSEDSNSNGDGNSTGTVPTQTQTPAPVTVPTPAVNATVEAGSTSTNVSASVDTAKGTVTVSLKKEDVNAAFDRVATENNKAKAVSIQIPEVKDAATYVLTLPAATFFSQDGTQKLAIATPVASITITDNMLASFGTENANTMAIAIGKGDKEALPRELKEAIGSRPLISLTLSIDGQQKVWNNPDAPVKVSIPYIPTSAELADPEHIVIWYIDGAGKAVTLPSGKYDSKTGTVTFSTTHFSNYTIAFVQKEFNDLDRYDWAKKPIEVLASKGIISGTSEKSYSPGTAITRAQYLYLLVKTMGLEADAKDNFSDISKDAYYYKELGIAKKLGITEGIGDGKFNPEAYITREDTMVLTERTLRVLGVLETKGTGSILDRFTDKTEINSYALDSIASLVKSGLIEGDGNKINPLTDTTRAEAAVFLYRVYNIK